MTNTGGSWRGGIERFSQTHLRYSYRRSRGEGGRFGEDGDESEVVALENAMGVLSIRLGG